MNTLLQFNTSVIIPLYSFYVPFNLHRLRVYMTGGRIFQLMTLILNNYLKHMCYFFRIICNEDR